MLFPAIDLLEGRAVRLHKGERKSARVYSVDPEAQARAFVAEDPDWKQSSGANAWEGSCAAN